MKTKAITLSAVALILSACDNTYTNWELPTVHRKYQPIVQQPVTPTHTTYTQPERPAPVVQQPVAPKPEPVIQPATQPSTDKATIAISTLPGAQIQPEFESPKPQPEQVAPGTPRPVMTQAQKEKFPVMPGQNRALKRRR